MTISAVMNLRNFSLAVLFAVFILIGGVFWGQFSKSTIFVSYGDVTVQQASELITSKPDLLILDVRTPQEYSEGHLKGSILIPVDEINGRLNELGKDKEILIYCRTGNRSRTAVNILTTAGYHKIYHMKDGISVWMQQGYLTEK